MQKPSFIMVGPFASGLSPFTAKLVKEERIAAGRGCHSPPQSTAAVTNERRMNQ